MAVHLTRSEGEGFEEVRTSNAVDGTDDDLLWNDSDEDGDVRSEWEEWRRDEGTDCDVETMTLIGISKQNLTCFEYEINSKIFF